MRLELGSAWKRLGALGSAWMRLERLGAPEGAWDTWSLGAPGSAWERLGAPGERLGAPGSVWKRSRASPNPGCTNWQ